ncbi:MAG: DNA-directed RNA polymerase [Thermoplasmata archaeon]|nr:DNA-directed RNA polymerase [Thermoplasmata archaeon]
MYYLDRRRDVVRIPPNRLGPKIETVLTELAQQQFEGKLVDGVNLTVLIQEVQPIGEGHIIHGDGGVYQEVEYQALLFKPELQEVVEGAVVEIRKFGAFVRFGPLDGLLHVSQIMDDRVNIDEHNQRLVGVETKRDLKVGYKVRARIVSLSLSEISPRDSRIGLTMRQPGLGRLEWIAETHKKTEPKESGKKAATPKHVAAPAAPKTPATAGKATA